MEKPNNSFLKGFILLVIATIMSIVVAYGVAHGVRWMLNM